eukprot:187826_1
MTINSGINTNNIIIDCTFGEGDECKHITINAQTAQFLQITIGSNSELKGTSTQNAIINCPQNSLYSSSSCIIDELNISFGILEDSPIFINIVDEILSDIKRCSSSDDQLKKQTLCDESSNDSPTDTDINMDFIHDIVYKTTSLQSIFDKYNNKYSKWFDMFGVLLLIWQNRCKYMNHINLKAVHANKLNILNNKK